MRTYDYILAMREQNQFPDLEDSDFSSDDSSDYDSPERPTLASKIKCSGYRLNQVYTFSSVTLNFNFESY